MKDDSIVTDLDGYTILVPSSWEIHNIYFPRTTKDWINSATVKRYQYLIRDFYSHRTLARFYEPYMKAISPHYQKIFLGYAVKFAIRLLIVYLDSPQRFRHNGLAVMMRYFTSLNAQLWTRIYQCNRHNMGLPLPEKGEMIVEKKYILDQAERFIEVLAHEAIKHLPKYQKLHQFNR